MFGLAIYLRRTRMVCIVLSTILNNKPPLAKRPRGGRFFSTVNRNKNNCFVSDVIIYKLLNIVNELYGLGRMMCLSLSLSLVLRSTVSRPVYLGIKHQITFRQLRVCWCGRSLWRQDGSVVYNCCWSSPAQSFSDPSPVGLVNIFYCLRFETSFFVACYDSQGYGAGIRPRLHTGCWGWCEWEIGVIYPGTS
jgi:hypothetical protein